MPGSPIRPLKISVWTDNLPSAKPNRPVPGVNRQGLSAAVHLPVDLRLTEGPLNGHRHTQADMPVAGGGVNSGLEIARQRQIHTAVARVQEPTGTHLGAGKHLRVHAAIARLDVEAIEAPGDADMPVAAVGIQSPIQLSALDRAVSRVELNVTLQGVHVDGGSGTAH